jgi:S-ribosylhomocysteine lyase LuxS involved in autoinducer biosynthesis
MKGIIYNLFMDKLKVIIEEPTGSRRSFFYNVKSEEEAKDIVKMVEKELRPKKGFSVVDHRIIEEK